MLDSVTLPFESVEFREVWKTWLSYRTICKIPYKAPETMQAALKKLSEYPEQVAILAIKDSIANQWQGIFPDKGKYHEKRATTDSAGQFANIYERVSSMYPE
jgi:hypothetical protein